MNKKRSPPTPLFDSLTELPAQQLPTEIKDDFAKHDFKLMKEFLLEYNGSADTFNTYRRELERLAQWAWSIAGKSILLLKKTDIEAFVKFCQSPPKAWIGIKKVSRYLNKSGKRIPNSNWRLFVVTLKKSESSTGKIPDKKDYAFSQKALQSLFAALGSFYNHLIREDITDINPVASIRQKSKFIRKRQGNRQIRRLSKEQWKYVIKSAEALADQQPEKHERTLFIISALYLMYLRISELVASNQWEPQMQHFYKDSQGRWWFKTVGKGNKERDISVSNAMIDALKRYRQHLNLSLLPSPTDHSPLIPKTKGKGAITSTREIRFIVQQCFDHAARTLLKDHKKEEAKTLSEATVHWLRHTGISDDLNNRHRPTAHVRDDAGHSSSATTDLYNDAVLAERHASAKLKLIN